MDFGVRGYQLKRIPFAPARNPDAHSINAAELGLIPLNDPLEVRTGAAPAQSKMGACPPRQLAAQASRPGALNISKNIADI